MPDTSTDLVPPVLIELFDGTPTLGELEQAFLLITTAADGFPFVCLLSRAEIEADPDEIRIAVTSRRTTANLRRDAQATLLAIDDVNAHQVQLTVIRTVDTAKRFGVACAVTDHFADHVGVALDPIGYIPTAELKDSESWEDNDQCLTALRAQVAT